MVTDIVTADQVHAAHADAWAAEGRARVAQGGGADRVRGARLMASGIPDARWNNADLTGPDVDLHAMAAWYDARGVPWGVRVPSALTVTFGSPLFTKRCFGLRGDHLRSGPDHLDGEMVVRRATASELDRFIATEARVFGDEEPVARRWIEPVFGRPGFGHWFALHEGTPAAVVTTVATDEDAGPAVMLTGAGALPGRDPDVLEHLLRAVIAAELARRPSALVHVHADPDDDTLLLARLGFVEVASLQVRSMA